MSFISGFLFLFDNKKLRVTVYRLKNLRQNKKYFYCTMQLFHTMVEKENRVLIPLNLSAPITWADEYEWASTVRSDRITNIERPKTRSLLPSYVTNACWLRRVKSPGKLTGRRVARMVLTIARTDAKILRYTFFATVCENNDETTRSR